MQDKERLIQLFDDLIHALARTRKLQKKLVQIRDDGSEDFCEAYALIEMSIYDARRWASYYERCRAGERAVAKKYKRLALQAKAVADKLGAFTREQGNWLVLNAVERLAPCENPLSPHSITKLLEDAVRLGGQLEQLSQTCMEPLPGVMGRPSDNWLLGYIWGMGVGWRELTTANVSPRGHFSRFLRQGLILLRPDYETIELESPIETAIERFHMKPNAKWLRPGDDLSRFPDGDSYA